MKKLNYFFYILFILLPIGGYSQGLKFQYSVDLPINERTSYTVFQRKQPLFSNKLSIEFDMQLYPVSGIGYVLRIKEGKENKIFNLFFDGRGDNLLKLNEEGRYTLITAKMDLPALIAKRWFKFGLEFNIQKDSIFLFIDGEKKGECFVDLPEKIRPEIVFGRSEYVIDVPPFSMKNLRISGDHEYFFPLSESNGTTVHNEKGVPIGKVLNPSWLINESYQWQALNKFSSESVAGSNYNCETHELYFFNRDTLWKYNVTNNDQEVIAFEEKCPIDITLGMNFIDQNNHKLYAYEVYYEGDSRTPSIASLDLQDYKWRVESYDKTINQLHHHSCNFNPNSDTYTIFGGFGNMRYSSTFYTYSPSDTIWTPIDNFSGDNIFPRYFSSMGSRGDYLYIFGGMGNESGEQTVGRKYFYDLYKVDLQSRINEKLWEIPWKSVNSVPVREMIIPDGDYIYTLCYPESVSDSHLTLHRFSINEGSHTILGDSITIHSDKITTNANLYYDKETARLYVTVQEFADDIKSTLSLYSILFPPISEKEMAKYSKNVNTPLLWILLGILSVIVISLGVFLQFKFSKRKKQIESINNSDVVEDYQQSIPNSILLFGDLLARNKLNRNISYLLSGKQEQAFIILLKNSFDGGITSRSLSTLLWPDRSEEKAKNIRGVTINHLRKTLQEFDGIELAFADNRFLLKFDNNFYCDYLRFREIVSSPEIKEEEEGELLKIVRRGRFLNFSTIPMYDSIKEETDSKIEPILQNMLAKCFNKGEYHKVLYISDAIFKIDSVNENALIYVMKALKKLKLDDMAHIRYQSFITEYKIMMGTNYPTSFKSLY